MSFICVGFLNIETQLKERTNFEIKNVLSIDDFSREMLEEVFEEASRMKEMKREEKNKLLENKVIATLFFEPSTRTQLSFQTAIQNLGAKIIGFSDANTSSTKKGETLEDTIRIVSSYCDGIVMRHSQNEAAKIAQAATQKAIINAGDGTNEHPTQAMLDLFTIKENFESIDGLNIGLLGDLKNGRTVHSLIKALNNYNANLYFISPKELTMPEKYKSKIKNSFTELSELEKVLPELDVLYVTRVQKERFENEIEYDKIKDCFVINKKCLEKAKEGLKVMHPLPRVNEISRDVDALENAIYFEQAENGLYVREALLKIIFN
jgi:aspartate carbamoyltransferase catalytic subunit